MKLSSRLISSKFANDDDGGDGNDDVKFTLFVNAYDKLVRSSISHLLFARDVSVSAHFSSRSFFLIADIYHNVQIFYTKSRSNNP